MLILLSLLLPFRWDKCTVSWELFILSNENLRIERTPVSSLGHNVLFWRILKGYRRSLDHHSSPTDCNRNKWLQGWRERLESSSWVRETSTHPDMLVKTRYFTLVTREKVRFRCFLSAPKKSVKEGDDVSYSKTQGPTMSMFYHHRDS